MILLLHLLCSKTQVTNLLVLIWKLIKAIAKDQGFEIEITNPGFDAAISAVQAGQADGIIAGMSVTDARKATFDFSESYYTANTILGVKESSTIASYEDLKGKTVGVKTELLLKPS